MAGDRSKACVIFYGMPEKDQEKLKSLEAPVLGIWASKDGWINEEVVSDFDANMKGLNKYFTSKTYDADHAFANPSSPRYSEEASKEAFNEVKRFLNVHFIKSAGNNAEPAPFKASPPEH